MSDVIIYKVDSTEIDEQFRRLDFNSSEMKRAINRGLSISANIVKKQGIANLMTVEYGKPLANADFLSKGISMGLWRKTRGATIGLFQRRDTVTFKGQKYKNPSYLLRWIDSGTTQRKTKKGKNRGTLAAKYFFRTAIEQTGVKAASELETNILNSIDKIANKR